MRPAGAIALVLLLSASARAESADAAFAEAWRGQAPSLVEAAQAMASACHDSQLFAERDRLAGAILRLDRDHAKARAWLQYKRNAGGLWEKNPRPKSIRDQNAVAKKGLPVQRRKRMGSALDAAWEVFERHRDDLSPLVRQRAAALLFDLAPEDERFAAATDRERKGDVFVVREALTSPARRTALRAKAGEHRQSARDGVKPARLTAEASGLGHAWKVALQAGEVRLITDGGEGEGRAIAAACAAAASFYREVVDPPMSLPNGITVLLVTEDDAWERIIDRFRVSDAAKERLKRYGGVWMPGTDHVLDRSHDPQHRLDGAVRQVLSRAFEPLLAESTSDWLQDGMGLYLGWLLLGTRYSYFVAASRYEDDSGIAEERLAASDADWFALARELLERQRLPSVAEVSGLTLNAMRREDSLTAHVFSAWLLEGHPDRVRDFLSRYGGKGLDDALAETFGYDLELVDARLAAWLRAVTAPPK